jgi:phenylalanyl-tRNA synthetase beta chain
MPIPRADVLAHLRVVGCTVDEDGDLLRVRPPTWRPDLVSAADLVEEVVRLADYGRLPSVLPAAPPGRGRSGRQTLGHSVARALAAAGYSEVISFPFVPADTADRLGFAADDPRRDAPRLVNPLSADEPDLRATLLPGLLTALLRNVGRGNRDVALFEIGLVFRSRGVLAPPAIPGIAQRPDDAAVAALDAVLPAQPRHAGVVLCGEIVPKGWWGPARTAGWADAIEAARVIARAARAELTVLAVDEPPWHPGRCAALLLGTDVIGHAGELHPRLVAALGLPERTCAMELDLDRVPVPDPPLAPAISDYPPVLLDVALVLGAEVPAADVERTLRAAAGPLLESVRLFDVYADPARLGEGRKSLAYALRFRAPDRTLTLEEATAARDAAIEAVRARLGGELRS